MDISMLHEPSNGRLYRMLPPDQIERVFASDMCDIEPEFLGFVGAYERLAEMIPTHWTVIDLGCAYAPQAYFFRDHAAYIGVDLGPVDRRFSAPNTTHLTMPIHEFCANSIAGLDIKTTFAICSYVPPWHGDNMKVARETFENVFTFYPAGDSKRFPAHVP